jgi:hypothetical protein
VLPHPAAGVAERWFVTAAATAPSGYRLVTPGDLPTNAADYLNAAVVALDNTPAGEISPAARNQLARYGRDFGGGLVIVGGDRAFSAGGYVARRSTSISPLAAAPPRPARPVGPADRRERVDERRREFDGRRVGGPDAVPGAADRARPAAARPAAGGPGGPRSFAATARWWATTCRRPARAACRSRRRTSRRAGRRTSARRSRPPRPRHESPLQTNLLLLSDADAEVGDPESLVALLRAGT